MKKIFSPIAPIRCFLGVHCFDKKSPWYYPTTSKKSKYKHTIKKQKVRHLGSIEIFELKCDYCGFMKNESLIK